MSSTNGSRAPCQQDVKRHRRTRRPATGKASPVMPANPRGLPQREAHRTGSTQPRRPIQSQPPAHGLAHRSKATPKVQGSYAGAQRSETRDVKPQTRDAQKPQQRPQPQQKPQQRPANVGDGRSRLRHFSRRGPQAARERPCRRLGLRRWRPAPPHGHVGRQSRRRGSRGQPARQTEHAAGRAQQGRWRWRRRQAASTLRRKHPYEKTNGQCIACVRGRLRS